MLGSAGGVKGAVAGYAEGYRSAREEVREGKHVKRAVKAVKGAPVVKPEPLVLDVTPYAAGAGVAADQ